MIRTKTARITLACAITYILTMGLANIIIYHFSHVSYTDPSYTKALLPFLCLLAAGTLCCFFVLRKRLVPVHTGRRRYFLFLLLFLPMVGMTLYFWFTNGEPSSAFLIPIVVAFLVGTAEEMMFRRILYVGLSRAPHGQDIRGALLVSALMFSLLHSVNILAGFSLKNMLAQLVSTFIAGLFYALMYDYTKSILLIIASHSLWDYLIEAAQRVPEFAIITSALNLGEFIIMLVLLTRKWRQEKVATLQTQTEPRGQQEPPNSSPGSGPVVASSS
ncbi:CAAX amino terminal protease self- immunity [Propionibacterium australiense]|uniref:CAAX protease self-immunity n=1 Tax=Propionibacterium australiense TaxID=119981 RepID=A0A383S829_9ACTN|nr:CAAX protease self-immunity [Propionibacterium australiense]VEH92645.1 CAAX amino terminal protease self- immunity [Propionibacterium australiense]